VIIRTIKHVEINDDKTRVNLHHPDGYVTGVILEPDQPFPVADTACVIEAGRVVFQLADGTSHTALQHAPALDAFQKSGAALATLIYDRLNASSWGRRVLASERVHQRLARLVGRSDDVTQAHVQQWWESAPERHRPKVETLK
jgi:hypothetical protein